MRILLFLKIILLPLLSFSQELFTSSELLIEEGLNKNSFTFKRRPIELIFAQAIYFEKKIKKWSAKKKYALAAGNFELLQILAECRNATHSDFKPDN